MPTTIKFGKGLGRKQDPPDSRDLLLAAQNAAPLREIGAPVASCIDVFKGLSLPVYDQGALGSCTANAGVLYRRFLAQRFSKYSAPDEDLSRLFLYYQERALDGDTAGDSGASVRDTFKVLASVGVCREQDDPYIQSEFASKSANDSSAETGSAAAYKIGAYHRVLSVEAARSCLASGYPVALGFVVYESFEEISEAGVAPVPVPGERILGGHAVVIRGYDDERTAFFCQNSWGESWGLGGCFWLPYEYLERVNLSHPDLWMGHLGKPWKSNGLGGRA